MSVMMAIYTMDHRRLRRPHPIRAIEVDAIDMMMNLVLMSPALNPDITLKHSMHARPQVKTKTAIMVVRLAEERVAPMSARPRPMPPAMKI